MFITYRIDGRWTIIDRLRIELIEFDVIDDGPMGPMLHIFKKRFRICWAKHTQYLTIENTIYNNMP